MIKVLFFGSGKFAVPILKELLSLTDYQVCGLVTQPDKPAGREQKLKSPEVKEYLLNLNLPIPIFQPEKLKLEAEQILSSSSPDLVLVASYGQMIPDVILNTPKYKALNIHGSLLPKLRGAVPIQMAILQGLSVTGVTFQVMVKQLDAGGLVAKFETIIDPEDTSESLGNKLAIIAAQNLNSVLSNWVLTQNSVPQNEVEATFCYEADVAKEKGEIKLSDKAEQANRLIKAFYPSPIAWTKVLVNQKSLTVKIYSASLQESFQPGTLGIFKHNKQLYLGLSNGVLLLNSVQLEGKKALPAKDYLWLATQVI